MGRGGLPGFKDDDGKSVAVGSDGPPPLFPVRRAGTLVRNMNLVARCLRQGLPTFDPRWMLCAGDYASSSSVDEI